MSTNERAQQKTIDENKKQENENNKKEYVLNKIFSGSFCDHELPYDVINFIKSDEGYRFAFVNPYGKAARPNIRYIFHIIKSSLYGDNNNKRKNSSVYELAAISEIEKPTQKEDASSCEIKDIKFEKIFAGGKDALKELFKVSHLWRPKGKPILIIPNQKEASITKNAQNDSIEIKLTCNPQHSMCYAKTDDFDVLNTVIEEKYLTETEEPLDTGVLDDEQCFSVIGDRTNLEDSISNYLAYFLQRDKVLLYKFLHDGLGIDTVKKNESFSIKREEKNIDLLFESEKHVVVIENKILSKINGSKRSSNVSNGKPSQLSNYYKYVAATKKYDDKEKHFYVLAPKYNAITEEKLKEYEEGAKYKLIHYNDLISLFKTHSYKPTGAFPSPRGKFLYEEFVKAIEYISWNVAEQRQNIAYVRLKQKLNELSFKNDATKNSN